MINRKNKKGFTLTELLVGLSIGIVVLTGLMSFYFRSSKMIGDQQTIVKNLSQLQFVMNRMEQDIKEANTLLPGTGTTVTQSQWDNLPVMCYFRTYTDNIYQLPDSSYPKEIPQYPLAYLFGPWQSGKSGTSDGWFPKVDPSNPSGSNELAFYKVVNNQITRVLYYTELDPSYPNSVGTPKVYRLRRKQQFNIQHSSTSFIDSSLVTNDTIILSGLNYIQFTYPVLTNKLSDTTDVEYDSSQIDSAFRTQIESVPNGDPGKIPYLQSILMNKYRDNIRIKIATTGPQIGNKRVNGLELTTEVNVKN